MTTKKRIEEIDILKALGIICMVAGHSGAPFTHFIYLFHMAVFFIASGFFFKEKSSDDFHLVITQIKGKICQLWFPFFIWNSIYVLLHNFFIFINVYTNNPELLNYVSGKDIGTTEPYSIINLLINIAKGALFLSSEQMFGASWFIRVLFLISVCYLLTDFFIKKVVKKHIIIIQSIISLLFLLCGYLCYKKNISLYGISHAVSYYCLYHLGYCLHHYKERYINWNWKHYLFIFFSSFVLLLLYNLVGSIELSANDYKDPLFLIITSLTGWGFLYSLSYFLKKITPIKCLLTFIGKRTLIIVILHFLSFKIVETIIVSLYQLPTFCIAAFPNLYGDKELWWLAYMFIGVGIPVTVDLCYRKCIGKVISKFGSKNELRKSCH